jgi:hypothetical protein
MILNYIRHILATSLDRRHRLLNPGYFEHLTTAAQVAAELPNGTADEMAARQAELLQRIVRRDRLHRLVVCDGTARRLGRWWPRGEHREMLEMVDEIVHANRIVRINGYGTIIRVVRELHPAA